MPFIGRALDEILSQYNRIVSGGILVEDTTAGRVRVLPGGAPMAFYQLSDWDAERVVRGVALISELLFAAGARRGGGAGGGVAPVGGPVRRRRAARRPGRGAAPVLPPHPQAGDGDHDHPRDGHLPHGRGPRPPRVRPVGEGLRRRGAVARRREPLPHPHRREPDGDHHGAGDAQRRAHHRDASFEESRQADERRRGPSDLGGRRSRATWSAEPERGGVTTMRRERFATNEYLRIAALPPRELERLVVRGDTPDLDALVGWEFRGTNAWPPLVTLLGIKKFIKGF